MAITDAQLYLTDGAQTVTTDEVISDNIIDLDAAEAVPGQGRPAYLKIAVDTAVEGDSVTFTVYEHTAATSVTSGNALLSFTRTAAELPEGAEVIVPLPVDIDEQYLGVSIEGGASLSAGAVRMWIDLG